MPPIFPIRLYGLRVPPDDVLVPGIADLPSMVRITMAAIDPTELPEDNGESNGVKPLRSTLKIVRMGGLEDQFPSSDEDDQDYEDDDMLVDDEAEESSDNEEVNGGPSDPAKVKKAREAAAMKSSSSGEDSEDEVDPIDIGKALRRIEKGKAVAIDGEDDSEDESVGMEEFVVCTLDPEKHYQQTLEIYCNENEQVFFKVTGSHSVYLTGNYVTPVSGRRIGLDDEYDLSPDEDELELEDEDDESDELDELEDPRVTEVDTDDDMDEAPKLVENVKGKGKNKRSAEDSESDDQAAGLDDIIAKTLKPAEALTNGEKKAAKKERKKLQKLNSGEAASVSMNDTKKEGVKAAETKTANAVPSKTDRKVQFADKLEQFADQLEQGPSKSKKEDNKEDKPKSAQSTSASLGVKVVQGVTIDDRKLGTGSGAKKGDKLEMRYIGKLENGKVFDSNKKGKPFSFKLGTGEVIKGWDIGLSGMAIGGERRLTIPANLAYGNKAQSGIPPNSTLIFDVKLLGIK